MAAIMPASKHKFQCEVLANFIIFYAGAALPAQWGFGPASQKQGIGYHAANLPHPDSTCPRCPLRLHAQLSKS
jgi:hypothetical protein